MEKWFCIWMFSDNRKINLNLEPKPAVEPERWEKSPFGTIFPNDRSATPTVGKPSLLPHDVFPTVAFDAFQFGTSSS
jgi:hypothetical protein